MPKESASHHLARNLILRFEKSAVFETDIPTKTNCLKISPKDHQDEATKESASHHSKARKLSDDKIHFGNIRKSRFDRSEVGLESVFVDRVFDQSLSKNDKNSLLKQEKL